MAKAKKATLKKTDYVMSRGTEKIDFKRGVLIDGKTSNLTVVLEMNHKKGLIKVVEKLDDGQILDDMEMNEATFSTLAALRTKALEYGINWRTNWKQEELKRQEAEGVTDQISMDLPQTDG